MNILKKSRVALALVLALALSGCMAVSAAEPGAPEKATAVYYMDALPGNWSVESAQTPEKEYLRSLTTTALYTSVDGELVPGLAAELPVDVTAEYAGKEIYGIPAGAERGYAFRITLRRDVFWEDGAAVDADDVLFSVRTLMQSKSCAQDYRWIANAAGYAEGLERPAEQVVSLNEAGFSTVSEAEAAGYTRFYLDVARFWGLDTGWTSIGDRQRILDHAMTPGLDEMYITPAYLYEQYLAEGTSLAYLQGRFLGITGDRDNILTMEDVGILKTGEYELVVIAGEPVTARTAAARLGQLCLLRQTLYGDRYGTAPEYYSSCGPYRITDAGADEILLERNEYWRGDISAWPADVIRCLPR